uniref:Uncharacterized protein n=1 Tax=Timema bartmani TaxID=61472 RepID=A0A7R9F9S8_9NEOP|nr:unnamed protein product [Timema bartmani]
MRRDSPCYCSVQSCPEARFLDEGFRGARGRWGLGRVCLSVAGLGLKIGHLHQQIGRAVHL